MGLLFLQRIATIPFDTNLIAAIDKQINLVKTEIEKLIKSNQEFNKKVEKLLTIKGVGIITITTILAETLSFQHLKNIKQLVSYAGYDVVQVES